jgi:lysylphosphatidylglycerol synthetase-like protein (DUF2156 family)
MTDRQQMLNQIRDALGEEDFNRLLAQRTEDELIDAFLESEPAPRRATPWQWLKQKSRWVWLVPILLAAGGAGVVAIGAAPGKESRLNLAIAAFWEIFPVVFLLFLGIAVLLWIIRGYKRQVQLASVLVAPVSAVAGVVILLLPSVDNQYGYVAFGVAAAAVLLLGASTYCVMFACDQCGSFDVEKRVDSEKLPGYSRVERHYRVCSACGHRWASRL